MAPTRDARCKWFLNQGIKIVKLNLLGSILKVITVSLKFLSSKIIVLLYFSRAFLRNSNVRSILIICQKLSVKNYLSELFGIVVLPHVSITAYYVSIVNNLDNDFLIFAGMIYYYFSNHAEPIKIYQSWQISLAFLSNMTDSDFGQLGYKEQLYFVFLFY